MKAVVRIFRQRFSDFGCVEAFAWICICYTLYYCGLAAMLVLEAQEFIKVPLGLWVALTLILKAIIVIGVLAAAAMFVSPIRYVWRKDYSMAKKGWGDAARGTVVAFVFFLALFGFTWPIALSLSGKEELYDLHLKTESELYEECSEIGDRHPANDLVDSVQTFGAYVSNASSQRYQRDNKKGADFDIYSDVAVVPLKDEFTIKY